MTASLYPAATAENVAYTYDQPSGFMGIGRLTTITDQSGSTAYRYDERGNVTRETRTIGGVAYVTDYAYDLADRLLQVTYPSGRIVDYARNALGRISAVSTKQNAVATPVTLASGIAYRPFGGITGFTFGNGLAFSRPFDQDERPTAQSASAAGRPVDMIDNASALPTSPQVQQPQKAFKMIRGLAARSATGIHLESAAGLSDQPGPGHRVWTRPGWHRDRRRPFRSIESHRVRPV